MTQPPASNAVHGTLVRAASGGESSVYSGDLPAEYMQATTRRLIGALWIGAGVLLAYVVLYLTIWRAVANVVGVSASIAMVPLSAGSALYLAAKPRSRRTVSFVACTFLLSMTVTTAFAEHWDAPAATEAVRRIPWSCVFILLMPLLIPASPRLILGTAFFAAVLNPVVLAITVAAGGTPTPDTGPAASLLLPPFVCALLAYLPSHVLSGLQHDLKKARQVGAYELTSMLGKGGMGEVWRAEHRLLARPAAIKLVRPELLTRESPDSGRRALARFEREAHAAALLESPHTVEVYDFGISAEGTFYCVMELLEGLDLERLVQERGPLPPARVVYLLRQACDSLEEAHQNGLVHRDVKPANIFAARKANLFDYVKVLDFGLVTAPVDGGGAPVGVTMEGQIQGTPAYMAPEAVTGEGELDGRADIYALGCVGYFLLSGKTVFEADTPMKMAIAHATEIPLPPSEHMQGSVPKPLEQVLMSCLEKQRDRRPQSAAALGDALAECALGAPWTNDAARRWWEEHEPDLTRRPPAQRSGPPVAAQR